MITPHSPNRVSHAWYSFASAKQRDAPGRFIYRPDVVSSRLENEYGVKVIFETYNCSTARWIHGDANELRQISDRYSANVALDGADDPVYLAPNNVYLNMVKEKYPNLTFLEAREVI